MSCFRPGLSERQLSPHKSRPFPLLLSPSLPPPHHWHYRIEGAQKIVFSNAPNHPPNVLLLSAVKNHPAAPLQPLTNLSQALFRRHLSPYLLPHHIVSLTPAYIKHLSQHATPFRPPHRRAASHISPHNRAASLFPDVAFHFGPNTTLVEIKPKAALLSRSRLIPPHVASALKKYTTPPYHIKNYLMLNGSLPHRPYIPSHLLCDDIPTVSSAISSLLTDNSRGLRVFRAGEPCNPEHHLSELRAAAHAIVIDNACAQGIVAIQSADLIDNMGAEIIMRHLIRRVGEQQATKLLRKSLYTYHAIPHLDEITYKSSQQAAQLHDDAQYNSAVKAARTLPVTTAVHLLSGFLQAAAAKDCSIMIALCKANEVKHTTPDCIIVEVQGVQWAAKLWVIDTDEKHTAKILGKWGVDDRKRASMLGSIISSSSGASQHIT
ncbi:hypothetical protein BWQ96_08995 [Gracilariopsis chorda]|uniref:Inositol-pentakisphosphate 2-kinase n=1 Tax=Gracilariopsis chorda TaxID=448386 RepID=A0A2V3IGQ7_9FLOR|nr:hypothetical protein BWQ96_08995 [Gracilariopsis chorda]|eukprot:PXF41286.1 hypothetical protein BWQ96_08995 [Gracilariopsis chorda]